MFLHVLQMFLDVIQDVFHVIDEEMSYADCSAGAKPLLTTLDPEATGGGPCVNLNVQLMRPSLSNVSISSSYVLRSTFR